MHRNWTVQRLTEFLPVSRESVLLLTRSEDPEVARIALNGIARFGRPIDSGRPVLPAAPASNGVRADVQLTSVQLLVRESYGGVEGGPRPPVFRLAKEVLEAAGLKVTGSREGGREGGELLIELAGMPWERSQEAGDETGYCTAKIQGTITLTAASYSVTEPFGALMHQEDRPLWRSGPVPYGELFARSDFIVRLSRMAAALRSLDVAIPLLGAFEDEDWRVQLSAAWALSEMTGPGAAQLLMSTAQDHPNWLARAAAVAGLGQLAVALPRRDLDALGVVRPLIGALGDEWPVSQRAAEALGNLRDPDATESLVSLAQQDRCWLVRKTAVWALGEIADQRR